MLIITNLLHLFDNFVYSRYNLNKTTKRQGKDIIFGVENDDCKNMLWEKKKGGGCVCSFKKNGTFFSGENDHLKCSNEEYLGRLF